LPWNDKNRTCLNTLHAWADADLDGADGVTCVAKRVDALQAIRSLL